MTDADTRDLAARVRELEEEIARLAPVKPDAVPPSARHRGRSAASALLIVVAALLVPVSIVSAWARVQLVDEESFVATLAPLADDPAVQAMIVDETVSAIEAQVDFAALTANVFDGIAALGLPPRAESALRLLEAPAATGLASLTTSAVSTLVGSEAFSDLWATTSRAVHRALTVAATSDAGGIVVRTGDGVGIQIGAVVDRVRQALADRGVGVAPLIPSVDRVIVLGEGGTLAAVRTGYALATVLGWWLPLATLVLLAGGILLARRRSTAVAGTGVALALGAGVLAAVFAVGTAAVPGIAGDLGLSPGGLGAVYRQLVASMAQTALVLSLLGVFLVALGWVMGRSRAATGVRRTVRSLDASARRRLAARGLDTGRFGSWLARRRVLVRTVIAALAVAWLYAVRPLTAGDVALVVIVALVVAWALELLQRRDEEVTATTAGDAAAAMGAAGGGGAASDVASA